MESKIANLINLINPKSFKGFVKNFMLLSGALYFVGKDISTDLSSLATLPNLRSWLIIKIVIVYIALYFIFYKVFKYILRYFFHSRLRDKIRKEINEFVAKITFEEKRNVLMITDDISNWIYKYLVKMGLITSNDLSEKVVLNQSENEDLFNEIVEDQYSWILVILHSLITTIVVFKFYDWWFISLMLLAIIVMVISVFGMIYVLLHLEILETIRKNLLRRSSKLM